MESPFAKICGTSDKAGHRLIKIVMLTGQRRVEVSGARVDELDLVAGTWTIAGDVERAGKIKIESRVKNGREQTVYLSRQVAALFAEQSIEARKCGSVFLFPQQRSEGKSGHIGDDSVTQAMNRLCERAGIVDLQLHDFRRAIGNHLGSIGMSKNVRDFVLNHMEDSVDAKHYTNDRSIWAPQAREGHHPGEAIR